MLTKILFTFAAIKVCSAIGCDQPGFSKCICGDIEFRGKVQYVLNCTDVGFTNASVLSQLPPQIQVLIFTGNNIPELPWNVFGTKNSNEQLTEVDMSNNNIREIRGKTYHRVPNVERLILNHNQISTIFEGKIQQHPRVFSNFESLEELHLTDAFADNSPEDIAAVLHNIFINSDLSRLKKLHLEQNEISHFTDPRLFCDLRDLMDLHLGTNKLSGIDFMVDCLKHLRFIDLEANAIKQLSLRDLSILDSLPDRNQNLTVDLSNNPLSCGCDIQDFFNWLKRTRVTIRNKDKLKCQNDLQGNDQSLVELKQVDCPRTVKVGVPVSQCPTESNHTVTFLAIALAVCLAMHVYTHRVKLQEKFLKPVLHSVSNKVQYTSVGKQETQEIGV
ncbi:hypothetical protein AAG570_011356 [Ranatra chinensis]|uniref:Trophoblast glycoprotein n=1 Tax=Ranatra chinensis TaxID=642074 RepID=A0ABD0Z2L6_9HEMI